MLQKSLFLENSFLAMRNNTIKICENLAREDLVVQPVPDVSPPKWHLGHTTWFLEEIILNKFQKDYKFFNLNYKKIFNSYYFSLGEFCNQSQRGNLSRPTIDEVLAYRITIENQIIDLLDRIRNSEELLKRLELAINHEEQHQELLLMDIKYILGNNPIPIIFSHNKLEKENVKNTNWKHFAEGLYKTGESSNLIFHFDNESPAHKTYQYPFGISEHLVTNNDYLNFINDGGYKNPHLWLSKGYDWIKESNIQSPLYWRNQLDSTWREFTLYGETELNLDLPVAHISYFEADAYARWKGVRLPTEEEFEISCSGISIIKDNHSFHPSNANTYNSQLWCWTQSHYSPYPGFRPFEGEFHEYNGKFMCNQFVLKGGSVATPSGHYRKTYRNFYEPHQRWMFSGICLAKDYL